jgi:hypothetical protein
MRNKLIELQKKRRIKLKEYNSTLTNSWKKRLKRIELQIIDGQINRERLIQQYQ